MAAAPQQEVNQSHIVLEATVLHASPVDIQQAVNSVFNLYSVDIAVENKLDSDSTKDKKLERYTSLRRTYHGIDAIRNDIRDINDRINNVTRTLRREESRLVDLNRRKADLKDEYNSIKDKLNRAEGNHSYDRDRDRDRNRDRNRDRHRDSDRNRDRYSERDRNRDSDRYRERDRNRDIQRYEDQIKDCRRDYEGVKVDINSQQTRVNTLKDNIDADSLALQERNAALETAREALQIDIKTVTAQGLPQYIIAAAGHAVRDRIMHEMTNAKNYIAWLLTNFLNLPAKQLQATNCIAKFQGRPDFVQVYNAQATSAQITSDVRVCEEAGVFQVPLNTFRRVVLVDYANMRRGVDRQQGLGIDERSFDSYLRNLIARDTNALYIVCKTFGTRRANSFIALTNNYLECNINMTIPQNNFNLEFNETDDYVMLALLKLLSGIVLPHSKLPIFVISADNYDWFTPINSASVVRAEAQQSQYPFVVYYSPVTGGQWCYAQPLPDNTIRGTMTLHTKSEGRRHIRGVRESLREIAYYNTEAFPQDPSQLVSVEATRHPILGHACSYESLRGLAREARNAPPGYVYNRVQKIYINTDKNCSFDDNTNTYTNLTTGATGVDLPECDTWTRQALEKNESRYKLLIKTKQEMAEKQRVAAEEQRRAAEEQKRAEIQRETDRINAVFASIGCEESKITIKMRKLYNMLKDINKEFIDAKENGKSDSILSKIRFRFKDLAGLETKVRITLTDKLSNEYIAKLVADRFKIQCETTAKIHILSIKAASKARTKRANLANTRRNLPPNNNMENGGVATVSTSSTTPSSVRRMAASSSISSIPRKPATKRTGNNNLTKPNNTKKARIGTLPLTEEQRVARRAEKRPARNNAEEVSAEEEDLKQAIEQSRIVTPMQTEQLNNESGAGPAKMSRPNNVAGVETENARRIREEREELARAFNN
jgi:hypothetical protein